MNRQFNLSKAAVFKTPRRCPEHVEQVNFFRWVAFKINQGDERYHMIYAIPNGGARDPRTGVGLKAEGVRKGIPDISVDVPSGGYHGLKIEMKAGKNKMTPEQKEYFERFQKHGYKTAVCYSFDEAIKVVEEYFKC